MKMDFECCRSSEKDMYSVIQRQDLGGLGDIEGCAGR